MPVLRIVSVKRKLHIKSLTSFSAITRYISGIKAREKFVLIFFGARKRKSRLETGKKMTGSSHHNDGDDGNGCDGNGGTKDICGGDAGNILFSFC